MKTLEGKTLSKEILAGLPARCETVKEKRGTPPSLVIVNFYPDSPSGVYARKKVASCEKTGMSVKLIEPDPGIAYNEFEKLIKELGENPAIDAIMIERPLPKGFDIRRTWEILPAAKDPDGISTVNLGRLLMIRKFSELEKEPFFVPCTALAVIRLMRHHGISPAGKNIAVAGRSTIVGKPLALMLNALDATVTVCHTKTRDTVEIFKKSDIIISAVGQAKWIKPDMLPGNAVLIDVGTNFDENGRMCGDADPSCAEKCAAMSPVPGGVGPVTKALLLEAAVKAAEMKL